MKKIISGININNRNNLIREILSGITEEELKQLVKTRKSVKKPVPTTRNLGNSIDKAINKNRRKYPKFGMVDDEPLSTPRNSVKQTTQNYEDNISKPVPAPRTKNLVQKRVPTPRTKILKISKAVRGYTKTFIVGIKDNKDPLICKRDIKRYRSLVSRRFMLDHCIAYFEAITEKVQGCQPNNDKSYTEAYQKHILTVVMVTKLFVVMMINIPNQFEFIQEKCCIRIHGLDVRRS